MEKYIDVMKRTIELSESCVESLENMKLRINEGAFEETIQSMDDLVNAVYQIELSIQGFVDKLPLNGIEERTTQLRKAMEHVVSAYEQGEAGQALESIQFNLLPCCKGWKTEIEKALQPHVLS
jgi:hypothetical protein